MSLDITLTPEEARITGCLMEKAVTTPDHYPLTLNALGNACNQKSSRDPVMSLQSGIVQRTARELEEEGLVKSSQGKGSVVKYAHRMCNTLHSPLQFNDAEYAIVCLLLLRGPQTPGEIKARSGRLYTFDDNDEVKTVLDGLIDRDCGAVVARLARKAGRKDHEYMHLLGGEIVSVPEDTTMTERSSSSIHKEDRFTQLEARVSSLEHALQNLAQRLGEEVNLGEEVDLGEEVNLGEEINPDEVIIDD